MGILPLKKCVNRDKCSFATKQRMFGVFAIDEILRYRGTWFPGSRTLCHPAALYVIISFKVKLALLSKNPTKAAEMEVNKLEVLLAQVSENQFPV